MSKENTENKEGKENKDKDKPEKEKKTSNNNNLKITEWRYSDCLGEKIQIDKFTSNPENESFLVTNCIFSDNGDYQIVSDKGGRIIIFKRKEKRNSYAPKLEYHTEFQASEKDFDVHKSFEYSEEIKSLCPLPISDHNKLDILSASYRNIHLDRIYQKTTKIFDSNFPSKNSENSIKQGGIYIPKVKHTRPEVKQKTIQKFDYIHTTEINSVNVNSFNTNNFMSSDEYKILLWDINHDDEIYNLIDLDPGIDSTNENNNSEKITVSKYSPFNPSIFAYGTNKGNLNYCDLRTNSLAVKFTSTFKDENSNLSKTIFANQLLSVQDINFKQNNGFLMATRQYLSVNLWDNRKNNEPLFKFLLYEPIINKLSYLYQNNYLNDKFALSSDPNGKFLLTGGYNNMFHILDVDQRLNSQIVIDDTNEKTLNTNVIRKINSKGSCFYKKDDPSLQNLNFDKKITNLALSPVENFCMLACLNCIYTYSGSISSKK